MSVIPVVTKTEVDEFIRKTNTLKSKFGIDFERELDKIQYRFRTDPYYQIKEEYDKLITLLNGI